MTTQAVAQLFTLESLEADMPGDPRLLALRQVYEKAMAVFNNNHRVKNALLLIINAHIVDIQTEHKDTAMGIVFKIRAQGAANVVYTVTKLGCNCMDKKSPETQGYCKHRIARAMVLRTQSVINWRKSRQGVGVEATLQTPETPIQTELWQPA